MTSYIIFTYFQRERQQYSLATYQSVLKYSTEWSIKQVQRVERDCKMCERIKAEKLHKSVRLQILLHHGMKSDSEDDQWI